MYSILHKRTFLLPAKYIVKSPYRYRVRLYFYKIAITLIGKIARKDKKIRRIFVADIADAFVPSIVDSVVVSIVDAVAVATEDDVVIAIVDAFLVAIADVFFIAIADAFVVAIADFLFLLF